MEQDEILEMIYEDIENMNENDKNVDPETRIITQTVINYAFNLIDKIKGKTRYIN